MWRIPVLIRYLLWYKWFLTDVQTKYGQWYGFVVFPVDGQVAQRDGRDGAPHGTCNAFTTDLDSADLGNLRRRFNEQYSQIANLLLGQARETTIGFKDLFTGVSRAKSQRQPASVVACTVVQEYVATLSEWQFQFASRAMLCKRKREKSGVSRGAPLPLRTVPKVVRPSRQVQVPQHLLVIERLCLDTPPGNMINGPVRSLLFGIPR
mmetsp:Transcript_6855/g.19396  ORF Transcript_6855/g.19396 Transcript_6855/m.19396 type:complete len:207 (-) Transcript_6855:224-844(-)